MINKNSINELYKFEFQSQHLIHIKQNDMSQEKGNYQKRITGLFLFDLCL